MQHTVDAGVHQLLLVIAQVLGHILRHKHNVTLHIHHKEEAVQGLEGRNRVQTCLFIGFFTLIQKKSVKKKKKVKYMQVCKNVFDHLYSPSIINANIATEEIIKHTDPPISV